MGQLDLLLQIGHLKFSIFLTFIIQYLLLKKKINGINIKIIIHMQKSKNSTIELHNIKQDIYLGFLADQTFQPTPNAFEVSFFGGQPILLKQLSEKQQKCQQCNATLSFLGQMYCPFEAQHCYHRVLYFLICESCLRGYKCIRQQAVKDYKPTAIKSNLKKICQAKQLQSEAESKNQFIKMLNRMKAKIEQDQAIEQAQSDEQDQKQLMKQVQQNRQQIKKIQELIQKQQIQEKKKGQTTVKMPQKSKQQEKDLIFQVYKGVITQLNNPCILYTDMPLPYNKRTLNPNHFCQQCGAKLTLQVQITERILNIANDPNSKLLMMDWGSIMVYTCGGSCNQGSQQCLVVQYQIDAINEQDLKKLKKSKKNRKKKQKKSNSKSKDKQQNGDIKEQQESNSQEEQKQKKMEQKGQKTQSQADWD